MSDLISGDAPDERQEDERTNNGMDYGIIKNDENSGELDDELGRTSDEECPDQEGDYEDDGDESKAIIQTEQSEQARRQGKRRYFCSYVCLLCRYTIAFAVVMVIAVGVYVIYSQNKTVIELEDVNAGLSDQVDALQTQVEDLKKGILEDLSKKTFVAEQLKCDDLTALGGEEAAALPAVGGCVSNNSAAALLRAQEIVLSWGDYEATELSTLTPSWIKRRIPYYGVWLYPRLKLVLFSCPLCGNSESRTMLTVLSAVQDPSNGWNSTQLSEGSWKRENDHSWQLVGTFESGNGLTSGDKLTLEAFRLVDELLARDDWSSLALIQHPYARFAAGYSELETQWKKLYQLDVALKGALDARPFWKLPEGSRKRVRAWWAEFVLGNLYKKDGPSGCLSPLPELYNVVPTSSGFWRDGSGSGAYYYADHVISIDQIHEVWPELLEAWGFDSGVPELDELADVHVGGSDGSEASKAAQGLLASDASFRESVDAFYAQDVSCFGFATGKAALEDVGEVATAEPSIAPTLVTSTIPTAVPSAVTSLLPTVLPTVSPTGAATAPGGKAGAKKGSKANAEKPPGRYQ